MEEVSRVQANPLGTEPIGKLLRQFAIPGCVSMVVNALYNIVDQIFIGRGVGYLGNGATNMIMPFTVMAIALAALFGDGCGAYFSISLGRENKEDAAKGITNAIMGVIALGILMAVVCFIFVTPFCRLTGATDKLLPYAVEYGRIIFIGFPICMIDAAFASIIRADGSPKFCMGGLLLGCFTNIALDYVFVFPLGMGMTGAALATIIGQAANAVLFIYYIARKMKTVSLNKEYWKPQMSYVKQVTRLGVSSMVTQLSVVVIIIVTNRALTYFGQFSEYGAEIPITAMGITMKVNNILIAIMSGIGGGVLPIIGFNYGAGKFDRVKKAILMAVGSAMICGAIATVFFQLIPYQIVAIFGTSSDLYMEFGVKCLKLFLALCLLDGMNNVIPTCFQAVGQPKISAISSTMRQVVFNVPPVLICPLIVGVTGCLFNGPIAAGASFIMNVFLLRKVFKILKSEELALSAGTSVKEEK